MGGIFTTEASISPVLLRGPGFEIQRSKTDFALSQVGFPQGPRMPRGQEHGEGGEASNDDADPPRLLLPLLVAAFLKAPFA